MCGIVGYASSITTDITAEQRDWLPLGRDAMTHRGPDDFGEWWSDCGRVGLAHRRLSILDLSPTGHQPMHMVDVGLSIIFNGEIYNFRELRHQLESLGYNFHSRSDTEVLLAAYAQWGQDCLERLNGMYAFAIFDGMKEELFIARDRAGEKPLFYFHEGNRIYFASELKALLTHPNLSRYIDIEALDCYLEMGYVPGRHCILKGYQKLPPAHAMTFNVCNGLTKVWRYWQIPDFNVSADVVNENILLDEIEYLLEDAVGKQLVADVPVGVLLSGGVDSSLITAMAVRHSSQIRTFSIGFSGHRKHDETYHARLIASYFNTEHVELMAEPATADLVPGLAIQFDEPMVDSSMIPTSLVSNLVRQHCTVALGGDGGDELFGGYKRYSRLMFLKRNIASFMPFLLRRIISQVAGGILPVGFRGRNYLQGIDVDLSHGLPLWNSHFDAKTRRSLMRDHSMYSPLAEEIRKEFISQQSDLLQRATRTDFANYLADDILVKVDRSSMLSSLEVRAPLLDKHVIEFAYKKVPSYLKANTKEKKILLKRLAKRVLPSSFDLQRKQGFSVPLDEWLRSGPFRDLFWSVLTDSDSIFNTSAVNKLLVYQDRGFNNGERLYALVQFELWRKHYRLSM